MMKLIHGLLENSLEWGKTDMDEYYNNLFRQLEKFGYSPVKDGEELFFQKTQGDFILLLRLVPEQLRGQTPPDLRAEHTLLEQTAKKVMVLSGRKAETLLLVFGTENPDTRMVELIQIYDNVWFVNRRKERVFIYENQKADFYGMEKVLEGFNQRWNEVVKKENYGRILSTFTPVNTVVVIINIVVFIVLSFMGDTNDPNFMASHGGMIYSYVMEEHRYWLLFTSMFVHFGIEHIGQNMLMLLMVGGTLERCVGHVRYLVIYLTAGLLSSSTSLMITLAAEPYTVSGGASGAICGVLGGILFIILENVWMKKKKRVEGLSLGGIIFIIIVSIGYGFTVSGVDNAAHLGGLIAGFILTGIMELGKNLIKNVKEE